MPEIGVQDLKTRASEIIRDVRDRRTRYVVTYGGRPVGILLPIEQAEPPEAGSEDPWDELLRLGQAIADNWDSSQSASDILSEMRR